eukprot:TRINITY_DN26530_c0_g3_i1.p1 TRINITY_DN26530_c0_g3~~TRINITY_DN26530_c0_g3_i1.p1  ORF type:complete len:186 (+),score=27.94 TRINITY_DN26530_c0_g3_i1:72-560(+)
MEGENRLATKGDLLYRALLIDPAYAPTYCSLAEGLAGLHSTMDFSDGVMLPDRLYNKLVSTYSTVFSDRIKVLDRSASFLMRTVTVALRGTTTTIAATESDAEDDFQRCVCRIPKKKGRFCLTGRTEVTTETPQSLRHSQQEKHLLAGEGASMGQITLACDC